MSSFTKERKERMLRHFGESCEGIDCDDCPLSNDGKCDLDLVVDKVRKVTESPCPTCGK